MDMVSALMHFNSDLSHFNQGLRQSLHLVISANFEKTRNGLERLLDKANQVVLEGTREVVDRYASSLSVPTMILFSMGVILPVMLFALLPLVSIGGVVSDHSGMGGDPMAEWLTGILLLLVFPGCCLLYARTILSRNPVRTLDTLDVRFDLPLVSVILASLSTFVLLGSISLGVTGSYLMLSALVLPSCILMLVRNRGAGDRNDEKRVESEFANALYQMGNRMLTGSSLEVAMKETTLSMEGSNFSRYAKRVLHLSSISRDTIYSLLSRPDLIEGGSQLISTAMEAVAESARKDCRAAGKVALNLAQNMNDLRKGEARMEERLRGVVDMMRSTALVFAPLVLGITSSLFGLIGMQTGQSMGSLELISLMVGTYLIELGLIVSYFTTFLMGEGSWREVGRQFASRAPVAVAIFAITSLISMNGMMALV